MNPKEEKDKAQRRKDMYLQFKAELEANPVLNAMLQNGYPGSRGGFIEAYAHSKVSWIEYHDYHEEWVEREDLQWVELANQCLDQILQKKLFDAQCLWRAEQLQLNEVEVTTDFNYWEKNVRCCPFIEPVNESDLALYLQYLQSFNFEQGLGFFEQWQDHEEITEAYRSDNGNRNVPEWYEFHNGRTGLGVYMTLPDVRLEKEEFYMNIWRTTVCPNRIERKEKEAKSKAESTTAEPSMDNRPSLPYHDDGWMKWFVETYEDKDTIAAFHSNKRVIRDSDYDEELQSSLELLARADRQVPMQGWFDWKEAVHKAADSYSRIRIAEAMPIAYEQYRLNIDLGLGFEEDQDHGYSWNDGYRKAILDAREENGEPRDFNF